MKEMKGFDYKNNLRPPKINYEAVKFARWDELLLSYMMGLDLKWESVVKAIRAKGDKVIRHLIFATFCWVSDSAR